MTPGSTLQRMGDSALPTLLRTPTGLAFLEIQGTLNLAQPTPGEAIVPAGSLVFPYYDPADVTGSKAWMKTVHLFVGKHQQLTGEVKKLSNAVAVMGKRDTMIENADGARRREDGLEILEIVEWKIVFSNRPEPVGG